jgi:SAM-dependent methyltransferase
VFTINLKRRTACHLTGVDGSTYALERAKELGFDALHRIADFSVDALPLDAASYDLVICKDVLEHLLHPEVLVAEMARILKSGGHVLVHVPNHFPLAGRVRLLLDNTIDPFGYFPGAKRWEFPHIRFFDRASLTELLALYGLRPVHSLCHHFARVPIIGRYLPTAVRRTIATRRPDAFAEGFTFLARKA